MKSLTVSVLSLAMVAATGSAVVRAQDYGNGNRNNNSVANNRYNDTAQVIRVTRINDQRGSYQRQQCWNEQTNNYDEGYYRDRDGRLYRGENRSSSNNNVGGTVIGGLAGGALGNQVGKGDGRTAATLAGVVIGAMIGNKVASNNDRPDNTSYRENNGTVRRCREVGGYNEYGNNGYRDGYNVTYRYAGRTYETVTRDNPGRSLPIVVDVMPRDGGNYRR